MSKLLLVLAVLCFAAMAQADTQIANVFYSDDSCTTQTFNSTVTAGTCSAFAGSYTSMFCSADGSNVFVVSYSDASCNSTFAISMAQYPTTCGWTSSKAKYACINPSAGPAAPFSFPPSGWTQSSRCVNATDSYKPASTCSNPNSDPAIHCTQSASIGGCRKNPQTNQPYVMGGCVNGDLAAVYFSDAGCSIPVGAVTRPNTCTAGVQSTCPSTVLPTLPTAGYQVYENDNCNTTATSTIRFFGSLCFNAQTFSCGTNVNGTTTGVLTAFSGDPTNAVCTGANTTWESAPGVCKNKMIYNCNLNPTPTGAASSTGSSMVAMVIAAIVALIASLSL